MTKIKSVSVKSVPAKSDHYLTADKNYPVFNISLGMYANIIDDLGDEIIIRFSECSHLENANWIKS